MLLEVALKTRNIRNVNNPLNHISSRCSIIRFNHGKQTTSNNLLLKYTSDQDYDQTFASKRFFYVPLHCNVCYLYISYERERERERERDTSD